MSINTANLANYHPQTPKRKPSDYADIMHHSRPHAKCPMDIAARSAQFSPYAALVGHKDLVATDEAIASQQIDLDHDIVVDYTE